MSVTHQDIAEKLGISRTLVTQALNKTRSSGMSPATRNSVLTAARQLGYRPRYRTTYNIGYAVSAASLPGETESVFMANVERALQERDYRFIFMGLQSDPWRDLSEMLNDKTVDGVLIGEWQQGRVRDSLPPGMPYVVVSDEDGIGPDSDVVAIDPILSMKRIVDYLLEHGHRQIALSTSVMNTKFYRQINEGAQKAVIASKCDEASLEIVKGRLEEIPHQMAELMQKENAPTAIMISDTWRAVPVLFALKDLGCRIPQDVSVVSYADSYLFGAIKPAITVTDQFRPELAEKAVARLLQKIRQPETVPAKTLIAGDIIERDSVSSPPSARIA